MNIQTLSPVRRQDELLAAMAAVLGYRPTESILLAVCAENVLSFVARIDVDWVDGDPADVLGPLAHALERNLGSCFLLGYSTNRVLVERSLWALADFVGRERVIDIAFTDTKRWWSLTCPGDCCPPEGLSFDFASARASAEAVFAGLPIGRDRGEIIAGVCGPSEVEQRVHAGVVHAVRAEIEANPQVDWFMEVMRLRADHHGGRVLDEVAVARFEVVLDDPAALVELLLRMEASTAAADAELFTQLVGECLERYAPSLLGLLGVSTWLSGGGPVLTAATQRLLRLDPEHPLAGLLSSVLAEAMPPSVWEQPPW